MIIPDSVTTINSNAFSNCTGLTSITIPDSVTNIGEKVFYNCSELETVYYNGTESKWDSVWNGYEYLKEKIKFFRYVTIIDKTRNRTIKKMYDVNSEIDASYIGKLFGMPVLYEDEECTKEFDLSTKITKNIVLYAFVKKTSTICVTASTGEKIFITTPYLPENCLVILTCYKDGKFVEMRSEINKNENIYFVVNADFNSAKIMAWESLNSMTPVCDAEIVR